MSLQSRWWDHWPQAEPATPGDNWALNYDLYWANKHISPTGRLIIYSRHTTRTSNLVHVFSQYEDLCDRTSAHRHVLRHMREHNPSNMLADDPVVVLGAPGIGKSVFLSYYAIRLMRTATPFIVYSDELCHLITPDGVKVAKSAATPSTIELLPVFPVATNTPFLLDIDDPASLPRKTILMQSPFFYVQVTSPEPDNYKWVRQYSFHTTFVMNPPTADETLNLLMDVYARLPRHEVALAIEAYGPSIRDVLYALLPGANPLSTLRSAIDALTVRGLESLARAATSPLTGVLVKTICPNPPVADGDGWVGPDDMDHVVANPTAMRLILARWGSDEPKRIRALLRRQSAIPHTPPSAAWLFESWAHARLCTPGELALHQMFLQHGKYSADETAAPVQVSFPMLRSVASDKIDEASELGTYYIPVAAANPTFDSFCRVENGDAYAFQLTLAKTHTLNQAGLDALKTGMRGLNSSNLVFVIPNKRSFSFAPPENITIPGLTFWVLYLEVDNSARSAIESSYEYWDTHER